VGDVSEPTSPQPRRSRCGRVGDGAAGIIVGVATWEFLFSSQVKHGQST
jgi:hypothetical protein